VGPFPRKKNGSGHAFYSVDWVTKFSGKQISDILWADILKAEAG